MKKVHCNKYFLNFKMLFWNITMTTNRNPIKFRFICITKRAENVILCKGVVVEIEMEIVG